MPETESKVTPPSMDYFVYDPAQPPPPKKPVAAVPAEILHPRPTHALEVFGGKLFSGSTLEDAKGIEKLLNEAAPPPPGVSTTDAGRLPSPVEHLMRLKKEIQQLKEDAGRAQTDNLGKARQLEQTLEPILADQRVTPYLPHISPSVYEVDPVEALIIRVRTTEGAAFQGVGKQDTAQPALLEQQVGALEKFVGTGGSGTLRKRVSGLQRDVEVLDPAFLVSCSRRIKSLMTELTLLDQQKRTVDVVLPTEIQTRIDALGALNAKHQAAIQEVVKPNSPFTTANPQQERAARALQRLHALAQQQKMASELLHADGAALKTLTENLAANMKLMQSNIASLNQRMQALPR